MKSLQIATIAATLLIAATPTSAQDFPPAKPVTLVVGFVAGGAADVSARIIAKKLAANIGQAVVVENRSGAGGNIAHHSVATGLADGSVLLYGSVGPLAISPHLMKLPYDPFTDLAPISGGVNFPNVLVVHRAVGVSTLAELVQRAKAQPGSMDYASTGLGSASHLTGELFSQRAGIDMVHIPYKGGAATIQDVLGERVTGYFSAPPTTIPHIKTGRLIPLGTTGLTRPAYLPNIPTIAEQGYPDFQALNWYGFVASAQVPVSMLERWNQEIVKVLNDPEVRTALNEVGLTPDPTTRDAFAAFIKKEYEQWGAVIRERNIAP